MILHPGYEEADKEVDALEVWVEQNMSMERFKTRMNLENVVKPFRHEKADDPELSQEEKYSSLADFDHEGRLKVSLRLVGHA